MGVKRYTYFKALLFVFNIRLDAILIFSCLTREEENIDLKYGHVVYEIKF